MCVLLEGLPFRVHVFSQHDQPGKPPQGFEFLKTLMPKAVFVNDLDTPTTLYHMANADMVVTSGGW